MTDYSKLTIAALKKLISERALECNPNTLKLKADFVEVLANADLLKPRGRSKREETSLDRK
jgi:hypothetical protein